VALRERASTISEALRGPGSALPTLPLPGVVVERLTADALAGSLPSLFSSGLNVLLFQQGRRWCRR
jgi:hypothetical protein